MISKVIAEELVHLTNNAIDEAEKIVIISHEGPDGDSIGSSLGLWHYLKTCEKAAQVIVPNALPGFLEWMPGADQILVYEKDKAQADSFFAAADLIFALDFNTIARIGVMGDAVLASPAKKILIDHHLNPGDFADVVISHPEIAATSELIFRIICRMGHFSKITLACAESIYAGMMSDTGGFTFNSNNQEIYVIISELLKIGVDKDAIYRKVYNTYSEHRLRLMGYCLSEKLKVYPEHKAALISLTQAEMQRFNYVIGDTEGFVNIPLTMQGIDFSVFIREDGNRIKISLRSEGRFPTNRFAADVFDGGGHLNASGGEYYGTLEDAIALFERKLPEYKDFLEDI